MNINEIKQYSKENILEIITWEKPWLAKFEIETPLFALTVQISLLTQTDHAVCDRSILILNQFLQLENSSMTLIKRYLWESSRSCFECNNYGIQPGPERNLEMVNRAEFEVYSPEDALQKSRLTRLMIDEEDQNYANNYGLLYFENPWEKDPLVIVMKNGTLAGYGKDGLTVDQFEQ